MHKLWYTRKNGEVKGPFPTKVISQDLLLGRLTKTDEVSTDKILWRAIGEVKSLIPEVMTADLSNDINRQMLEAAKRNADERGMDKLHGVERRIHESEDEVKHRHQRSDTFSPEPSKSNIAALMLIFAFVAVLVAVAVLHSPTSEEPGMDCTTEPAPGVNWSNCLLLGSLLDGTDLSSAKIRNANISGSSLKRVKLSNSDLAYTNFGVSNLLQADLSNAQLVGASFQGAYMRGANLTGSDLSYADFRGADLLGATFKDAKLDHAVWVDKRVCAVGSVGECR